MGTQRGRRAPDLPATLRERRGLLLEQVAERMGTRIPNVSRYENGEVKASGKFIARWASAVGETQKAATQAYWWAILLSCRKRMREAREQLGTTGRRK